MSTAALGFSQCNPWSAQDLVLHQVNERLWKLKNCEGGISFCNFSWYFWCIWSRIWATFACCWGPWCYDVKHTRTWSYREVDPMVFSCSSVQNSADPRLWWRSGFDFRCAQNRSTFWGFSRCHAKHQVGRVKIAVAKGNAHGSWIPNCVFRCA